MASIEHPKLPSPLRVEGAVAISSPDFSFRVRFETQRVVVIFDRLGELLKAARDLRALRRGVAAALEREASPGKPERRPRELATGGMVLPPLLVQWKSRPLGRVAATPKGLRFLPTPILFLLPGRARAELS